MYNKLLQYTIFKWVSEWLSFWNSGHRGPCSLYKPCKYGLYIGIIIFTVVDKTQSTDNVCNVGGLVLSSQNFVTVGLQLKTAEPFHVESWSVDQADSMWLKWAMNTPHLTRLTQGAIESLSTSTVEHILIIIASAVVLAGLTYAHVRFCGRKWTIVSDKIDT